MNTLQIKNHDSKQISPSEWPGLQLFLLYNHYNKLEELVRHVDLVDFTLVRWI
jgi:hypothetical protein